MRSPGHAERRPAGAAFEDKAAAGGESVPMMTRTAPAVVDGRDARVVFDGGPKIAGVVLVDARERKDDNELRDGDRVLRALQSVERVPAGASVVLTVAAGQCVHPGIEYVRQYGQHVTQITIVCDDARTVGRWVRGLREGIDALVGW